MDQRLTVCQAALTPSNVALETELPFSSARLPMIRPPEESTSDTDQSSVYLSHRLPLKPMFIQTTRCPFSSPFAQDSSTSREIPTSTDRTVCALPHIKADSCIRAQLLVPNTDS